MKTALDLTPEEWKAYYPDRQMVRARVKTDTLKERRQHAWQVATEIAQILRDQFSASRIVVFGSLVHETWFTQWSDIDLAVWGVPPDRFYQAVAVATSFTPDFKVDLIDPKTCRSSLRQVVETEGVDL